MRSSTFAAAAALVGFASAQTFTDCNPLQKTCPTDPALGTTLITDWTKGESKDWEEADGTNLKYGPNGAEFTISKKTDAPTIGTTKYIFFGKVEAVLRSGPGTGTVSSFILESDDLDEVDWEWLGSTDTSVQSNFFGKGNTTTYDRAVYHPMSDPINSWHTYTIEWTSQFIKWSIDGNLVRTLNYGDALALGGKNYPQTPMRVKMGNWIGCHDVNDPKLKGTCEWAGGAVDLSKGPFTMYVKSVTIQDYSCASEYVYGDMSGSYQSIQLKGECNGNAISPSGSSTKSASSSAGAILIESSTSGSGSSTSSSVPTSSSASSAAAKTTLSTASAAGSSGGSATSSSATANATTNAAKSTKSKYGMLDVSVMALGLGLGYLVM